MSAPSTAASDTNLVNLVLALLTPMFLWATAGDIRLAHAAAAEALNEFRIANRLSLFTAAKIIAFDIATLSSLSLSMYEDVSVSRVLRLRGNANGLDRSAERNRRRLEQDNRTGAETEDSVEAAIAEAQRMVQEAKDRIHAAARAATPQPEAAPPAEPDTVPTSAPTSAQRHRSARPDAMAVAAGASTAEPKDLPPAERWQEMAKIEALTVAAADTAFPPPIPAMAAE
jgi:hypothetical protein